jgi:iron complex transport system ATP-binding protein
MAGIHVKDVSFHYTEEVPVLRKISLEIQTGQRWALLGKNGSGKSTLLKAIGGLLPVSGGSIAVEGKPVAEYRPVELARHIAYVPQATGRALPPFSVAEFVMLGRFPYQGFLALPGKEDRHVVEEVLCLTDTETLAGRPMQTLSGGELQRVYLAAAVAQRTGVLLLDEPMSFLDPFHHEMMYRSLQRVHTEFNTTIITVTHDVNFAINRCSHVCALRQGELFFAGRCDTFLEKAMHLLKGIYAIEFSEIVRTEDRFRFYLPAGIS